MAFLNSHISELAFVMSLNQNDVIGFIALINIEEESPSLYSLTTTYYLIFKK